MRQHRLVKAAFDAGATTATYTTQFLDGSGGAVATRQTSGSHFSLAGMGAMAVGVPADLANDVVRLQYQVAASATGPWYDARDEAGELIQTPKADSAKTLQDCKGDSLLVDVNMFAFSLIKIVPLNVGGTAEAPGAVTFELSLKE